MVIDGVQVDDAIVAKARSFRVNEEVRTPNGCGVVQGRLWNKENGTIKILVAHHSKCAALTPEMRAAAEGRVWVLWAYEPDELTKG